MDYLEKFIINAKANGWVGLEDNGKKISSSRPGSHDISYEEGNLFYQDSFVGFSDFCGQEHICEKDEPVWSMVYYGYLVRPDLFDGTQVVGVLKSALSSLYKEKRFLGGHVYRSDKIEYRDMNFGEFNRFNGIEKIWLSGTLVYELQYCGGSIRK